MVIVYMCNYQIIDTFTKSLSDIIIHLFSKESTIYHDMQFIITILQQ